MTSTQWVIAGLAAAFMFYALAVLALDFIPVAGQLDDAILVALVLRAVLRSGGEELLDERCAGRRDHCSSCAA